MPRSQPRADRAAKSRVDQHRIEKVYRRETRRRDALPGSRYMKTPPFPADAADPAPEAVNAAPLDRSGLKPGCALMLSTENGYRQCCQPLVRNGYSFCQDHSWRRLLPVQGWVSRSAWLGKASQPPDVTGRQGGGRAPVPVRRNQNCKGCPNRRRRGLGGAAGAYRTCRWR